jgi:short-subunit dehydrogenase/ferredoxin
MKSRPAPRCALITGASQGLGRALADECAARGMSLFLVALPGSGLPDVAQCIAGERKVRVDWLETDLTSDGALDRLMTAIEECDFQTDLLVNNAGISSIGLFEESPLFGHESVVRLNALSLVQLTHRLIPTLKRRQAGYILNVASLGAFFPMVSHPVYSATKSFVLSFSLAVRDELRQWVSVGALCPNTIRTDRTVNEYVDRLPLVCRQACLSPAETARAGIDGLLRGQAIIVPGLINKLLRFLGPFVPRSLVAQVVRRLWGGFGKELKSDAAQNPSDGSRRVTIAYHSAAGGTRLVAELLGEQLSRDHDVRVADIQAEGAVEAVTGADFLVFCYPTYFLRPSRSMKEFISRLEPAESPRRAYIVTTYELYTENSLRVCARLLKDKGISVMGWAAIRAPGSDLACVLPHWLCPWLYRFERGLTGKLLVIAAEIRASARLGGHERLPRPKWYTPFAQVLQRALLDGFFEWRNRIRVIPERCSACGACVSGCARGGWVKEGDEMRHDPERCELCTRCIHHCPRRAVVLSYRLKDNPRLDARLYARLKAEARDAFAGGGELRGRAAHGAREEENA